MSRNAVRYSEDFKQQIFELYKSGDSVSYLSREYGVANVMIYNWTKELTPVQVSTDNCISSKEYEKMKKRTAQLEMENDILKIS